MPLRARLPSIPSHLLSACSLPPHLLPRPLYPPLQHPPLERRQPLLNSKILDIPLQLLGTESKETEEAGGGGEAGGEEERRVSREGGGEVVQEGSEGEEERV